MDMIIGRSHRPLNSSRTIESVRQRDDNSRGKVQNVRGDSSANPLWGVPRIHGELGKLGIEGALAMKLSKRGVWAGMDAFTAPEAAAFAKRVEAWGYGALWIPEAMGRNSLVHAAWLLANTTKLVIATGIANIYARDWVAASSAQKALNEQSGGRFLLGLGVSHSPLVEGFRGQHYGKPVATMRAYLAGMKDARYVAPPPPQPPKTVIAALGPQMLALAAEQADGAHPYNVTAEHTAEARRILGPGK